MIQENRFVCVRLCYLYVTYYIEISSSDFIWVGQPKCEQREDAKSKITPEFGN